MRHLIVLFLFVTLTPSAHAIRNGRLVKTTDPVAQVSVKLTEEHGPTGPTDCTGTRIAYRLVLTAAHCVSVANHAVFVNGASFRVTKAWTHPEWNDDTDAFDFAILKVEGDPPGGRVAEIADPTDKPLKIGAALTVAGAGFTGTGGDGILYKTKLKVKTAQNSTTEFFTTGSRTGVCGGDSGGGYLKTGSSVKIFGVVSTTIKTDRYGCDHRVYMADVSKASDWIRETILKSEEENRD